MLANTCSFLITRNTDLGPPYIYCVILSGTQIGKVATLINDDIRKISHELFGNADRLAAAAAIGRLEGKPISVQALSLESGLDSNRTQERVAHFHRIHLLVPDFNTSSRRKDFRAIDSSFWASCARFLEELKEREETF